MARKRAGNGEVLVPGSHIALQLTCNDAPSLFPQCYAALNPDESHTEGQRLPHTSPNILLSHECGLRGFQLIRQKLQDDEVENTLRSPFVRPRLCTICVSCKIWGPRPQSGA